MQESNHLALRIDNNRTGVAFSRKATMLPVVLPTTVVEHSDFPRLTPEFSTCVSLQLRLTTEYETRGLPVFRNDEVGVAILVDRVGVQEVRRVDVA